MLKSAIKRESALEPGLKKKGLYRSYTKSGMLARSLTAEISKLPRTSKKELFERFAYFDVHGKVRSYDPRSLFLFDEKNRLRYAIVWLVEWVWF